LTEVLVLVRLQQLQQVEELFGGSSWGVALQEKGRATTHTPYSRPGRATHTRRHTAGCSLRMRQALAACPKAWGWRLD